MNAMSKNTWFRPDLDKDMRSSAEHGHGRHDGEGRVGHQTQPVQDHGSKLPVTLHCSTFFIFSNFVRDHFDLFQDETEFSV